MRWTVRAAIASRLAACVAVVLFGCSSPGASRESGRPASDSAAARAEAERDARTQAELERATARVDAAADSMDARLRPVRLLRPAERSRLRQYLNDDQLARARALGIRPVRSDSALDALVAAGRLVRLPDSTALWVVRELDHSRPLLTPDADALLGEVARRFQAALDSLGLPPLRLEVTSALRTADDQGDLRSRNPNAASGTSTHEYGTTLDVAYSAFAAPATPIADVGPRGAKWLEAFLRRYAASRADAVGGRRSRELEAILGHVLLAMQAEGKVMVTREVQEPVFHMTVARRLAARSR